MTKYQIKMLEFLLKLYRDGKEPLISNLGDPLAYYLVRTMVNPDLPFAEQVKAASNIPPMVFEDFRAVGLDLVVNDLADDVEIIIDESTANYSVRYRKSKSIPPRSRHAIEEFVDALVENNNPSNKVPYHNLSHLVMVDALAQRLLVNPTESDRIITYLAAMFHDFGHTAGHQPDHVNIEISCCYLDLQRVSLRELGVTDAEVDAAIDAIKCTQFPFVMEPRTPIECALRDADSLYATISDNPKIILDDLRKEIEVATGKQLSYRDMYESQKAFCNNAKFYTEAGQHIWDAHGLRYLERLGELVNLKEAAT